MKNKLLLGKDVDIFLDGGWSFSGKVILDKKDYLLLLDSEEQVSLIYKVKVSCVTMVKPDSTGSLDMESSSKKEVPTESNFVVFKSGTGKKNEETKPVEQHRDDLSEGGLSLPQEVLLSGSDFGIKERKMPSKNSYYEDFSISLGSLKNLNPISGGGASNDRK